MLLLSASACGGEVVSPAITSPPAVACCVVGKATWCATETADVVVQWDDHYWSDVDDAGCPRLAPCTAYVDNDAGTGIVSRGNGVCE